MSSPSLIPRRQTYDVLTGTRNSTAADALLSGLTSTSSEVRTKCIKILLGRPEVESRAVIVAEWNRLDANTAPRWLTTSSNCNPPCAISFNMARSLRNKLPFEPPVIWISLGSAEIIPLALDKQNPVSESAMQALIELCDRWVRKLAAVATCPQCARLCSTRSLELSTNTPCIRIWTSSMPG